MMKSFGKSRIMARFEDLTYDLESTWIKATQICNQTTQ